jgi:hypothetical protein
MAVIQDRIVVAANTRVKNALAGSVFQFLRADSEVRLGIVTTAAGAILPGIRAKFAIGDLIVAESIKVKAEKGVNQGVDANTDLQYVDFGRERDSLGLEIENFLAAPHEVEFYLLIT